MPRNNRKNKSKAKNKTQRSQQTKPIQATAPDLLPNSFSMFVIMDSDWHIGSGGGIPGSVDRLVQRDREGIPGAILAKSLTGIWRDACEAVALGLDNGDSGVWSQYVTLLFGDQPALNEDSTVLNSPIGAALNIRPAELHRDIRSAILARPDRVKQALIKAMTLTKPGISIDPVTGCAIEKFLRQEEMVRAGTLLESQCRLNLARLKDEQKKPACALLIAGAKYVERLGGKRRRGAGKCRLDIAKVKDKDMNSWFDWIESNLNPPQPFADLDSSNGQTAHQIPEKLNSSSEETIWYRVPLTIDTKLPIIIKARTVGNVVETLDYIPGKNLLPIVAKQLGKLGINLGEAISNNCLIVTNATATVNNRAGRPVSLALFYEKMLGGFDKGKVYNQLVETPSEDKQLKGYRQGYVGHICQKNDLLQLPDYRTVNTIIQTHNTIDDSSQRPTEDIGGVYSYQAIEASTTLQGELRLTQDLIDILESKKQWWNNLTGEENIGTSKKDDYGLVEITAGKPVKIEPRIESNLTDSLIVWLLSDVLIRDRQLRPSIALTDLQRSLSRALNRDLSDEITITPAKDRSGNNPLAYLRQRRTESWQQGWGLPRPSLAGLMAGSCIKFDLQTSLDSEQLNQRLQHLEIVGIGERTAEGYGQISFNDPLLDRPLSELSPATSVDNNSHEAVFKKITSAQKSFAYERAIEKQAWRNAINNSAKALASNPTSRERLLGIRVAEDRSCPSMSQLGNLRVAISRLREPKDTKSILQWLKSTQEKRPQKWENTNDGLNKITALVSSQHKIWDELAQYTDIPLEDLTLTENAEIYLGESQWSQLKQTSIADSNNGNSNSLRLVLWSEAIRTTIYECIRAHKRDFE